MINLMKKHPVYTALIALLAAAIAIIVLFHPATAEGARDLYMLKGAGDHKPADAVPAVQPVPKKQDAPILQKPANESLIRSTPATVRHATVSAKQKRIAEIREEITALVEELNALLADN